MAQATRPYFQSYIAPSNNSNNIEANTVQEIENRKKQQEQEDKTDFFNQFLMTMALGQFLNGSSGQSAGGAIGSMLGMGLVPVGMQLGDKLFGHLFGKNNEATGVNSRNSEAINEDISRNSVHPQPQPLLGTDFPKPYEEDIQQIQRQEQKNQDFLKAIGYQNSYPWFPY